MAHVEGSLNGYNKELVQAITGMLDDGATEETEFQHDGRTIIGVSHDTGYTDADVKVAGVYAHPDDHTLPEGVEMMFTDAGLIFIYATSGENGISDGNSTQEEVGRTRRGEASLTGQRLRAKRSLFLGHTDGNVSGEKPALTSVIYNIVAATDADVYIFASDHDRHPDHRAVTESGLAALRTRIQRTGMEPPLVLIAEPEDGRPINGSKPNFYFSLTPEEYERHVDSFRRDHDSQAGKRAPAHQRAAVERVVRRPIENAKALDLPGAYIGRVRQDTSFSTRDPRELMTHGKVLTAIR